MASPASSIADAAPELQAWLFRESTLVGGVINLRYGSLYPHIFVTAKEPGTEPTKIWPLHTDCAVSPVNYASYTIRQRHTSTIWALATGKYETKKLWGFVVSWPKSHHFGKEALRLCDFAAMWSAASCGISTNISNGVAVYQEQAGSGAFMVPLIVRADPQTTFQALISMQSLWADPSAPKIRSADSKRSQQPITGLLQPPGMLSRLMAAPRKFQLEQHYRREDDGSYIILFNSTHGHAQPSPPPARAWSWYNPVEAKVESAGFTIAPLRPGFSAIGEASHESLVTAVFKVDLGGWLSQDTWTGRCLGPFLRQSFTDTLASCAIWLRDRIEQESVNLEARAGGDEAGLVAPQNSSSKESFPVQETPKSPALLDSKYYSCPGAAGFKIRGPDYLKDKKKLMAEEPAFSLHGAFLVEVSPPETPTSGDAEELGPDTPFDLVLSRFLAGAGDEADQNRHRMFKLIPSVVQGSWVIKQAVGNTPVLLGRKLATKYFKGPGYFEQSHWNGQTSRDELTTH
ncbi:hypothetical protein WJX84_006498 [Apatococcus fuscideae]|uniref:Protein ENHANCED DISEASE RESISTANCE 2 C-terminal domain-containing protein n=1 Tax=Apatococcus fuscideae TaxID=2026836 RepID=A0AAW1T5N8_9CHLO